MNITLLKKEIKSNWLQLIIFLAVLTMYGVMVTMMYEPELGESLKMMAESMPEIFAAFGMAEVGETLLEFLSGYLYGMLFVAFPGVFIIILTNRLCAKYVDNGSMAYLLAGPGKRREIMRTQAIFMVGCLVLMVLYVFGLLAVTSEILFPGELDMAGFFYVNVGLLGILLFFGGAGFFVSCLSNESRHAVGFTSAVVVYTILVQMISQVGACHDILMANNVMGIENLGGDLDKVTNQRFLFCAFPLRWYMGDGTIVRAVAFVPSDRIDRSVPDKEYPYGVY